MSATVVYVSNAESGSLSVFTLDETRGVLAPLQTLELGGIVMPIALDAARRRLIVARRSAPFAAVTCAIASDGRLTHLGDGPLPGSMAYVSLDATGRWLFGASYTEDLVSVSPVGDDGLVGAPLHVIPTGRHAHAIRTDRSNRFVFATSLGGNVVGQWRFDAATGAIAPNDPPTLAIRAGAGPRHLELHPNGRAAYLLNELDATLDVLALDPDRGTFSVVRTLPTMPAGSTAKPWAADLHLRADGRFLYTSERTTSRLAGFAVDAGGTQLSPIGHFPVVMQPRGFHLTASGRWLVVAGERSNTVALHESDAASGALSEAFVEVGTGRKPNWVETLALD